ncbi:MAG: hypothetical protein RL516_1357 [Bacteroidota bacterium]
MKKQLLVAALFLSVGFVSCNQNKSGTEKPAEFKDVLVENMDTTINPADDFFGYACGGWIKNNPIPASEKGFGIWTMVMNETYNRTKTISEEAGKSGASKGSIEQKIGDFYFSGMDTVSIDKNGIKPLKSEIDAINSIKTKEDVLATVARMQVYGASPLYSAYIYQDEMNSEQLSLHIGQGGIGLPDRDYYFNNDSRTKNIREEYKKHIVNMFKLMGQDSTTASTNMNKVWNLELSFAKASRKLEELRDPYANYNKKAVSELVKLTPSINWVTMFTNMKLSKVDTIIVGQPEFLKQMEASIKSVAIEDWKAYFNWCLINAYGDYCGKAFEQEAFNFNGKILNGVKTQRERYKRVLDEEESCMGDLLGQLYVKKYVSPSVKKRYEDLTTNIITAYRDRIKGLDWMSAETKEKAINKLNTITVKCGYPDKWKDYSSLSINRDAYVINIMNSHIWAHDLQVSKLGKPVDRTEWDMTPQTYNAYYNPSNNEIVLPAAIFIIPGLPDSLADDAIIYGYAGASTIGHEVTHGFDDQGRQFDEKGNLKSWWTANDEKEFKNRAQKIIDQFNNFTVLDSLHVNGDATQGENIADLGGVVLGLEAFKKTEQYKSGKVINGLTPLQRYFMGYALSWVGHYRDEVMALRIMTDVHSPNFLRVQGPVMNVPEFYEAFNVKPNNKMFVPLDKRVKIW